VIAKRVSRNRWRFAQYHERLHQEQKARSLPNREPALLRQAAENSVRVSTFLDQLGYPVSDGLVVEVGAGAHGLIWKWPAELRIAIDPLAAFYRRAFAVLQADGPAVVAARGEQLPIQDATVDIVLSDNVLDHVQDPASYLTECRRILRRTGVFFFTVDVHHPVYWWLGVLYNALFHTGLRLVVPAFPPHPFHFSERRVQRHLAQCGFRIVWRTAGDAGWLANSDRLARGGALRRTFTRMFWKNTRLEMVAVPAAEL